MKNCVKCGEPILLYKSEKYCSQRCCKLYLKSEYRKRNPEKCREWKARSYGGRSSHTMLAIVKNSGTKYCLRCGTKENLNKHHIRPRVMGGEDIPENIITLCFSCHMRWHRHFSNDYWIL